MSDLTTFRDHARAMATSEHLPWCRLERPRHWTDLYPHPGCKGCNPAAERELWTRLVDEVDAYLAGDEEPGLFGDAKEPTP